MIPRTQILAAAVDESCDALLARVAESSFSRLLLYEGTIDNVVGVIHLKDLLCLSHHTSKQTCGLPCGRFSMSTRRCRWSRS